MYLCLDLYLTLICFQKKFSNAFFFEELFFQSTDIKANKKGPSERIYFYTIKSMDMDQ